ncbi:Uma2 family endonuclease [Kamptonema formosum]|uniref:Uma2 family endonuclease n=1 Tax=Kamptonema formosum TaxID=331992 RepID=UPI0003487A81|nr:Uma2 family endonuclease [Oscillatoria sp. PCC 10802]
MSLELLRRQFTVKTYQKMIEAGIFTEEDRVELIRGEIIEMTPIGRRHAAYVNRLVTLFTGCLGNRAIVAPQNPVELGERSQPQPDVALLQPRPDFYEAVYPQPENIFLLVEVADTAVESDRLVKIPLYAEEGILEVWLVDINEECVEVYRQPAPAGYQEVRKCRRGDSLSLLAFPDITIIADEVLG